MFKKTAGPELVEGGSFFAPQAKGEKQAFDKLGPGGLGESGEQ